MKADNAIRGQSRALKSLSPATAWERLFLNRAKSQSKSQPRGARPSALIKKIHKTASVDCVVLFARRYPTKSVIFNHSRREQAKSQPKSRSKSQPKADQKPVKKQVNEPAKSKPKVNPKSRPKANQKASQRAS
jgi:hypothetical protein